MPINLYMTFVVWETTMYAGIFEKHQLTKRTTDISKPLDWRDRPVELQNLVDITFNLYRQRNVKEWRYQGDKTYSLCGINEFELIKSIIKSHPDRKTFTFMDIGAGDFSLGRHVVKSINNDAEIPNDVIVHMVSLTAEQNSHSVSRTEGKCKIYEFCSFKIECLESEFKIIQQIFDVDFTNQCDAIFTRWCLYHLVDVIGTLVQIFNLLRPTTGLLLADGFKYSLCEDNFEEETFKKNFFTILLATQAPFIIDGLTNDGTNPLTYDSFGKGDPEIVFNHFVLRRPCEKRCELPLSYNILYKRTNIAVDVLSMTGFKAQAALPSVKNINYIPSYSTHYYSGDQTLFDDLNRHRLVQGKYIGPFIKPVVVATENDIEEVDPYAAALNSVLENLKKREASSSISNSPLVHPQHTPNDLTHLSSFLNALKLSPTSIMDVFFNCPSFLTSYCPDFLKWNCGTKNNTDKQNNGCKKRL